MYTYFAGQAKLKINDLFFKLATVHYLTTWTGYRHFIYRISLGGVGPGVSSGWWWVFKVTLCLTDGGNNIKAILANCPWQAICLQKEVGGGGCCRENIRPVQLTSSSPRCFQWQNFFVFHALFSEASLRTGGPEILLRVKDFLADSCWLCDMLQISACALWMSAYSDHCRGCLGW